MIANIEYIAAKKRMNMFKSYLYVKKSIESTKRKQRAHNRYQITANLKFSKNKKY
jgi:hypothetical protein